ncbi:CorA family divalent cation transporter [Nostocoides vanveenii]|uniref:Magnesium and cobalt transport protein CorA n=1 Tax=Nostocoides vanveenii TaxID=330835 RepID=A0ABN2K2D5_9MICO
MATYDVIWVPKQGAARAANRDELAALLARDDGFVWVDVPEPDDDDRAMLADAFGLHPRVIDDCYERNHVARLHYYPGYVYLALHRPLPGAAGHVHYLEIDQIVGKHYLITTHGPRNPAVELAAMTTETREIAARLLAGRLTPEGPIALAYAVTSALTNAEERIVNTVAGEIGQLEQRVMAQADDDHPQQFLDELFTARHALLTVQTMATQSAEVFARVGRLMVDAPKADGRRIADLRDQYLRLERITRAQMEFLHGVTDFYRARTDTRMTIAAERLAVIAAVTLPVTAISSVMGMNVIVNADTHWGLLAVLLVVMIALSTWLLRWAHRQGWW